MAEAPATNASRALRWLRWIPAAAASAIASHAVHAAPLQYADLRNIIPLDEMSIVQNAGVREFRYTHDILNAGPGPLEIQPVYSNTSGNFQGFQNTYSLASGTWSLDLTTRVAGAFVFHGEHGHFHFPLASFGLYAIAADGGVGAPVVLSPKNGFCIDNSYLKTPNVPNVGAFLNHGSCSVPTSLRGLSVGYVDEYDYRDPGQSIPIDGIADGTYWFRAFVDPLNYLVEGDESNNITDVKVRVTGNTVEVLSPQITSVDSTPPSVAMTSPTDAEVVTGTIALTSSTPVAVADVQYLVDGQPLAGAVAGGSDHAMDWDTTTVQDGPHWLAAQVTDLDGVIGTSAVVEAIVTNATPPPPGALAIDRVFTREGAGSVVQPVTTSAPDQLLLAFVAADGPNGLAQSATVSGGGLGWTLKRRANGQNGTSEIWAATAASPLTGAPISSSLTRSGYQQSMVVVVFDGAEGVGATAGGSASNGAPSVQYASTADGSWAFGVGNDWDDAMARSLPPDQIGIHEVLAPVGDTFWVQSRATPVADAGVAQTVSVVAPATDRWNLAAVEVLPAPVPTTDTTPPAVGIDDPADGSTVSGIVTIAATAADSGGIREVEFFLDDVSLGPPVTAPPFLFHWNTAQTGPGAHTLTATATDLADNTGDSPPVYVTVDDSVPPPEPLGIDATVFRDAIGVLTTPPFSTTSQGDLLVAFVAYDGPSGQPQTASVAGAGVTWSLVKRSNSQPGTAEIWSAKVFGKLSSATVSASPGFAGYHGSLTVVAFTRAGGTGVAGATGATSGEPNIYLPGIAAASWVWAVGSDWDDAIPRTPVAGQTLVHQRLAPVGDTFWVQRTNEPTSIPGIVEIRDSAPTGDRWNYAAVEIVALPEPGTAVAVSMLAPVVYGLARRRRRLAS